MHVTLVNLGADLDPTLSVQPRIDYFKATPRVIREGEPFQLECRATGYPGPTLADFRIFKVDQASTNHLDQTTVAGGIVATVEHASSDDTGEYRCLVNIEWKPGSYLLPMSASTTVTVYSKYQV